MESKDKQTLKEIKMMAAARIKDLDEEEEEESKKSNGASSDDEDEEEDILNPK